MGLDGVGLEGWEARHEQLLLPHQLYILGLLEIEDADAALDRADGKAVLQKKDREGVETGLLDRQRMRPQRTPCGKQVTVRSCFFRSVSLGTSMVL